MHIKQVILKLGYSSHEADVYLASLGLGASTISEIAEKVRQPRTSVQLIIEKLNKRGLMNSFIAKKRRLWVAENPEKLLIDLKESEAAIQKIMPELQALRYNTGVKPTYRAYQGVDKIKLIWQDIIEMKHHVRAIIAVDEFIKILGREFLEETIENRAAHFLKIRMLSPRSKESIRMKQMDAEQMRHTRFLPDKTHVSNITLVYANKVAIISLSSRTSTGIIIEDQETAASYASIFDCLWGISQ
jgi:sugar-specific transcriptional regulator TrmB